MNTWRGAAAIAMMMSDDYHPIISDSLDFWTTQGITDIQRNYTSLIQLSFMSISSRVPIGIFSTSHQAALSHGQVLPVCVDSQFGILFRTRLPMTKVQ